MQTVSPVLIDIYSLFGLFYFFYPAPSRAFLSPSWLWHTREILCMNRVRSLLSMRGLLLDVVWNSVLITVCLLQGARLYRFIYKRMLALEKNQFDEREQDWLVQSEVKWKWSDSGRSSFSPPHFRRQKKAPLAGWRFSSARSENVNWRIGVST